MTTRSKINLKKGVIKIVTKRTEYNKNWQNKNKEYNNYLKDRSKARSFIKNKALQEDLEEFKSLIKLREEVLKSEKELK